MLHGKKSCLIEETNKNTNNQLRLCTAKTAPNRRLGGYMEQFVQL